ncbi:MAG: hypothetical protein EXR11_11755 [Rhodospirillaceae bacterium]|nr:hypothetical protein [Rhodospirillaceae bacterium]
MTGTPWTSSTFHIASLARCGYRLTSIGETLPLAKRFGGIMNAACGVLRVLAACGVFVGANASSFAQGQPAQSKAEGEGTVVTYDRQFFAEFNALTAEDLLKRIPGIQDRLPQSQGIGPTPGAAAGVGVVAQRGFSPTGDPILINGRRLSGKANDIGSFLQRIQAQQVLRIEVIRGSVPGFGVRVGNAGTLINIVLEDTLSTGSGSWEASANFWSSGILKPGAKLSYTGTFGALNYVFGAALDHTIFRRVTHDTYFASAATLDANRPSARLFLIDENRAEVMSATGNLSYSFDNGDIANLNGRYAHDKRTLDQPAEDFSITPQGVETFLGRRVQLRADPGTDDEIEVGGDYEHFFENGDSFKGIFVANSDARPSDSRFFSGPATGPLNYDRQQLTHSTRTEKIVRGSYDMQLAPGRSIEAGAEAAINTIDQSIQRLDNVAGLLRPFPQFNPDSKVKENRLETFASYSWQTTPAFYIEGAIDTEYSRLDQKGRDVNTTRSFFFVKPRVDVRYRVDALTQIRGRIVRTISQLDFANFVSTFVGDDVRLNVILAGNPNLVPEKTWTVESTYEQRFANRSVVSAKVFYNRISDKIEKIRIVPGVAGTGNVGNAKSYGLELKSGLRLDDLGVRNGSLDASFIVRDSSVRDAFTNTTRAINGLSSYFWTLNFRQDTDWRNLAYGFTVTGEAGQPGTDIDYTQTFQFRQGELNAFVEVRPGLGDITLRLEASRLLDRGVFRYRAQYVGDRGFTALRRIELRDDHFDRTLKLIARGTF